MDTSKGFMIDLPVEPCGAQMGRGAPGNPQPHSFIHMGDSSMNTIPQERVDHSYPSQISGPLMNRMAPENPQPEAFVNMGDSSMNLLSQNPADPIPLLNRMPLETPQPDRFINMHGSNMYSVPQDQGSSSIWRKHHDRTSFSHKQHKELESLFSQTMFPDKNTQKELALKLNIEESRVKIWFRNRRSKLRKQQQQQQRSLEKPSQILPAKENVPISSRASANPYSFFPVVSHSYSFLPHQPLGPSNWARDSDFSGNRTRETQMQDRELEMLVASVPALYSDAYDISQIMELYSFPDENEISSSSFSCLYQYLSPTRPQLGGQGNMLSNFAGPAVGLSPERTWSSGTSQGFEAYRLRYSLEFQNPSSMVDYGFLYQSNSK
ncbi:arginine-fifty homeobox-like [Choloepus didactylus]|uniref:arginine-fifty homeobox-like n=1 Tax=Choloepus didactylus TaxID=27675 RepID=UPI00189D014D|nr:arginine-fifty homeobox-like [Choloepus didactylus]